jgi:transposase
MERVCLSSSLDPLNAYFAPYAPEENPLEAIWFQLKNLLRRFYRFGKNFKIINLLFEFLPNIIFSNFLT